MLGLLLSLPSQDYWVRADPLHLGVARSHKLTRCGARVHSKSDRRDHYGASGVGTTGALLGLFIAWVQFEVWQHGRQREEDKRRAVRAYYAALDEEPMEVEPAA